MTVIVSFTLCWLMQDIFYPKLPAEQIDSLINTADDKYYSEDYINAERLYKHIIKVSGTASSYELLNRSHAKLQIKDYEGAIKDFDNAIKIDLQHGCDNECYIGHAGAYSTMISIIAQNLYTELDKKDKSSDILENIELLDSEKSFNLILLPSIPGLTILPFSSLPRIVIPEK